MAKRLVPSVNRVMADKIVPPAKTGGGIVHPERTTKLNYGDVVAMGHGACDTDGKIIPISMKEGNTVPLTVYSGAEAKLGDNICMNLYAANSSSGCGKCHHVYGFNATGSCILLKSFCCGPTAATIPWSQHLSFHVGEKSSDLGDKVEDGFSDLDVPPESSEVGDGSGKEDDEDLMSEGEVEESDEAALNSLDFPDAESKLSGVKVTRLNTSQSPLIKFMVDTPRHSLTTALDKYVEEGKRLGRGEISLAMLNLRKRRLYSTALQVIIILKLCLSNRLMETKALVGIKSASTARIDAALKYVHEFSRYVSHY